MVTRSIEGVVCIRFVLALRRARVQHRCTRFQHRRTRNRNTDCTRSTIPRIHRISSPSESTSRQSVPVLISTRGPLPDSSHQKQLKRPESHRIPQRRTASNVKNPRPIFQASFSITFGNVERNRLGRSQPLIPNMAMISSNDREVSNELATYSIARR
jgi:hypothetical protein